MSRFRTFTVGCSFILGLAVAGAAHADHLRLVVEGATKGRVQGGLLRPIDVYLVAERDSSHQQISALAYTLQLPEGVLLLGEELLVESLFGLGNSTSGMNLMVRCIDVASPRVMRFRLVPTRPLQDAPVTLTPDPRTHFLGIVSCKDENFAKFDCAPDSMWITAR
jgi:hypothetical protein